MDKIGLERDEYNGESFPFFQDQSPGSHTKKRIVILNKKFLKRDSTLFGNVGYKAPCPPPG